MDDNLYLFWFATRVELPDAFDFYGDAQKLAPALWLIRSDLSRSRLYHRLKWQLPEEIAILVAPLADDRDGWPKFKGMEPGALKWLRRN